MTGQANSLPFSFRRWGRQLGITVAAISIGLTGPAPAQGSTQDQFAFIAEELLAGIGSAGVEDIPAIGGYGRPRIAVAPFRNAENIVPASVASEYNTRLLAEMTRRGRGTYRFVARETLRDVIRELDSIEELEPTDNSRVVDLLRNARVDILIVGALRKTDRAIFLSYKAVSVGDGLVFAATRPRAFWLTRPSTVVVKPEARQLWPGRIASGGRRPVYLAQQLLADLGYDPGPVDGMMRPILRRAIRAYQYDFGQVATGRMTRRLIRELRASLREEGKTALALP
jgi:hypothetical protein